MPELPEIETVVRSLSASTTNFSVDDVVFYSKALREPFEQTAIRTLILGHKIREFSRRGKYILIKFAGGSLIFHFGMTGKLLIRPEKEPVFKHTHLIFCLKKGRQQLYLHYVDPRRFGRLGIAHGEDVLSHPYLKTLGVEPLENDSLGAYLYEVGQKTSRPIKSVIMDAEIVVGVGNIYASEALFTARIHPLSPARTLARSHYLRLAAAIQKTLLAAIEAGGTTFRDYQNLAGEPGYFALALQVYGRAGANCQNCQKPITKTVLSGRSTYFCPHCQKIKK